MMQKSRTAPLRLETAGELLLLGAAILAILIANSPSASIYGGLLDTTVAVQVGTLEIKREMLEGELSSFSQVVLQGAGAVGGMVVPAAIYA